VNRPRPRFLAGDASCRIPPAAGWEAKRFPPRRCPFRFAFVVYPPPSRQRRRDWHCSKTWDGAAGDRRGYYRVCFEAFARDEL